MFLFLDRQITKFNKFLKNKTTMDFSDWGTFLFLIIGIILIVFIENISNIFNYNINLDANEKLGAIVLWTTAMMIMQYTKETYWLKKIEQKNLKFQQAPFIVIRYQGPNCFIFQNVGRGVARNIEWEIVDKKFTYPKKTVVAPGEYEKIYDFYYKDLDPADHIMNPYRIKIIYENLGGTKYTTELKSHKKGDEFEVLKYNQVK